MEASRGWFAVQPLLMIWYVWPLKHAGAEKSIRQVEAWANVLHRWDRQIAMYGTRKVSLMAVGARLQLLFTSSLY